MAIVGPRPNVMKVNNYSSTELLTSIKSGITVSSIVFGESQSHILSILIVIIMINLAYEVQTRLILCSK